MILQIVTDGKNTSERGAVVVSTVVTTVAFLNSVVWVITKQNATMTEDKTINIHKIFHAVRVEE